VQAGWRELIVTDEAKLLKQAYARLGLFLVYDSWRGRYDVYDSDAHMFVCFAGDETSPMIQAPTDIEDFLKVAYFEHYRFPDGNFKLVNNVFFGMSREELELRLVIMGP
jgi:hypothetical protein